MSQFVPWDLRLVTRRTDKNKEDTCVPVVDIHSKGKKLRGFLSTRFFVARGNCFWKKPSDISKECSANFDTANLITLNRDYRALSAMSKSQPWLNTLTPLSTSQLIDDVRYSVMAVIHHTSYLLNNITFLWVMNFKLTLGFLCLVHYCTKDWKLTNQNQKRN